MSAITTIQPNPCPSLPLAHELAGKCGQTVSLHGMVYRVRRMRGFAFVLLRTAREVLQCVYEEGVSSFPLSFLQENASVECTGLVRADPRSRQGFEILLRQCTLLSAPEEEAPVSVSGKELNLSLETLLDLRPLTLRRQQQRAIFRVQSALCQGSRGFLEQQGFTEIHTPKIVQTGAEGGANIFPLEYFGQTAYLAQSPQFYKQAMVGALERVYEIGPVFRAEKHDTSRHLNEYTSVDLEMGFLHNFEQLMALECAMLRHAFAGVRQSCAAELDLLGAVIPTVESIPAIPFAQAKERLAREYGRPSAEQDDFEPEEERLLCESIRRETGSEFVFVTHYPTAKRPFYAMDCPENPACTESFDLLFRGLEITTGGQRIHNYQQQVEKMARRGLNPALFESYLLAHKCGLPPHGGLGLGLERLTARLLELPNLRQASLFPRDIHRLVP